MLRYESERWATVKSMTMPTLGVLGGMGPAATADFLVKLARRTPAERDQDHLRTVVYSDPTTPDRSDAILGEGDSPLPAMTAGIRFLEDAGVDLIAIPCNTAHYWFDKLAASTSIPIVHMVQAVNAQISTEAPQARTVGLLATEGTVRSRIYHEVLGRLGRTVLTLDGPASHNPVMAGIRAVKAGQMDEARQHLHEAITTLTQRGAHGIIYGCTDVSAALDQPDPRSPIRTWDAADALAASCVQQLRPTHATYEVPHHVN